MSKHQRKWHRRSPPKIKVLRLVAEAKLPTKSRESDHCFDFYAAESARIHPGETIIISLGLKFELPKGYALILKERSGLASKGIIVGAGVIDEEYRGEVAVVLRYMAPYVAGGQPSDVTIRAGDKIVQGKLERTIHAHIKEVTAEQFNSHSTRGEKGFGSSGTR